MALTTFEAFIIALDDAMKDGARAEQALRAYVLDKAKQIRQREADRASEQRQ